jgi:PTS system ascorbate-specific IIA component
MVGILLVTHNGLGDCLADCVKHVFGEMPKNLRVLSVWRDDDPQHKLTEGEELIKELDSGSGVLILIDVFGATPSNIGRRLCHADRVEGVAGVNLPMLLRVVSTTNKNLTELANLAFEGGRECIVHMEH